jgi:hypothetical protein
MTLPTTFAVIACPNKSEHWAASKDINNAYFIL